MDDLISGVVGKRRGGRAGVGKGREREKVEEVELCEYSAEYVYCKQDGNG